MSLVESGVPYGDAKPRWNTPSALLWTRRIHCFQTQFSVPSGRTMNVGADLSSTYPPSVQVCPTRGAISARVWPCLRHWTMLPKNMTAAGNKPRPFQHPVGGRQPTRASAKSVTTMSSLHERKPCSRKALRLPAEFHIYMESSHTTAVEFHYFLSV